MPGLSPPNIVAPLSACARQVRLQGQVSGATISIYASSPGGSQEQLFSGTASGSDEAFTLTRRLKAGETVYATQASVTESAAPFLLTETVEPEPDPTEIGSVDADSHLHVCASCAAFGDALPGAEVIITSSARGKLGNADVDPLSGAARVHFDPGPLVDGEALEAQQFICGHAGPVSLLPTLDHPANTGGRLSAPTIKEPLLACERAVLVENVEVGAIVTLFRDGAQYSTTCFDYSSLWYRLADPLKEAEHIKVDQSFPTCQLGSPPSKEILVDPAAAVPQPELLGPFCKGTTRIGVSNLRYGARIRIIQTGGVLEDGYPVANAEAWDETCDIPLLQPLDPTQGRWLIAVQSLCDHDSPESDRREIEMLGSALPPPWIVQPLYECGSMVRVAGIEPGARIEILMTRANSHGFRRIAVRQVHSRVADIPVAPPPLRHRYVFARQTACNQTTDSATVGVNEAPIGNLMPPTIDDCDDHLDVTNVLPGARVEVYLNGAFFKDGMSGSSTVRIPLDEPLEPLDVVKARQLLCGTISNFGPELTIRDDVEKRRLGVVLLAESGDPVYDDNRFDGVVTERICTLSAPEDPEPDRYPIQNNCYTLGILGTDLGIVIDHDTGDGRLYFFFGDTWVYPDVDEFPANYDAIARTSAPQPGPHGPELEFLGHAEPGYNDPENIPNLDGPDRNMYPGWCNIPGISQAAFEVPTGGFSHAGKLYIFFTTDHYTRASDGWPGMGRSVLAAAADWRDDFQIVPGHDVISTHLDAASGNFKFINIAPWKIRNDDWPHLPDNAVPGGEGLILMGSGDYAESKTCLAYVPLPPGRDPVRSEWRYLSSLTPSPFPNSGPCGRPSWSSFQADAMFLWDDSPFTVPPGKFSTPTPNRAAVVGELSIAFIPQVRLWIALYRDTAMRCAPYPWGPWSEPLWLFQYERDHADTTKDPNDDPKPRFLGPNKYIYGPYIIPRFTEYEPVTGAVTLYYAMSTGDPYAAMLMRTTVKLTCGYNASFGCPTPPPPPSP